jgi:hypothetical protein
LAEQSLNTSIVHPGQSSQDQGDRSAGNWSLTDPDANKTSDRSKL